MPATESRTYIGQPGTIARDGWAGFAVGRRYTLRLLCADGQVCILYAQEAPEAGPLVVTSEQYEKWFVTH